LGYSRHANRGYVPEQIATLRRTEIIFLTFRVRSFSDGMADGLAHLG